MFGTKSSKGKRMGGTSDSRRVDQKSGSLRSNNSCGNDPAPVRDKSSRPGFPAARYLRQGELPKE